MGNVGGLFGIVFAFIAFFLMSYNEIRYELLVGEGSFSQGNGLNYQEENFNAFTYIKYSIYDWIKFLLCCDPAWETCKKISASRDEANEQLDIKYFMKRLGYLEKVAQLKTTQEEEILEFVSEPMSLEKARKKRKIM